MIEAFIDQALLKAKARTGAGEGVALWLVVAALSALFAAVFLSIALYVWLAGLYGGAVAALDVGLLYAALALGVVARIAALRRRNRLIAAQRLALAAKPAWPVDPALISVAVEIGKAVGWRRLLPLALAGVGLFAATSLAGRSRHDPPDDTAT